MKIIIIIIIRRLKETCCHSNSSEKPSAKTDVKNPQGINNNEGKTEKKRKER